MTMRWTTALLICAMASTARAEPPGKVLYQQGSDEIPACAGCHGADGAGNPEGPYPALAGQPTAYLAKQLADFRQGTRGSDVMAPIAGQLNDRQAELVLQYVAGLKPAAAAAASDDAVGRRLAVQGRWDAGIPPCESCHGKDGAGVAPSFPRLAGQSVEYVTAAFESFRNGARRNDPLGLMKRVAEVLSPEEAAAAGRHFQALGRPK
jgi:cytochrome c553